MTASSLKSGAPWTLHVHPRPRRPLSSAAAWGASGRICPRTPPSGRGSPSLSRSPRVHRVDWGCRRRRNQRRRSLGWDFDSSVECNVWNSCWVCDNSGKLQTRGLKGSVEWIYKGFIHWDKRMEDKPSHWRRLQTGRRRLTADCLVGLDWIYYLCAFCERSYVRVCVQVFRLPD